MRTIVGVVSSFRVVNNPYGIVSSVVKDDVHNAQEAISSQSTKSAFKLCPSLLSWGSSWCLKEVVVNSGLSG